MCPRVDGRGNLAPVSPPDDVTAVLAELHRRIEARVLATVGREGLTLRGFAERAGFGAAHLRRIIKGPRADRPTSPSLAVLARLAKACGLDTWQLIAPLTAADLKAARSAAADLGIDFE